MWLANTIPLFRRIVQYHIPPLEPNVIMLHEHAAHCL